MILHTKETLMNKGNHRNNSLAARGFYMDYAGSPPKVVRATTGTNAARAASFTWQWYTEPSAGHIRHSRQQTGIHADRHVGGAGSDRHRRVS